MGPLCLHLLQPDLSVVAKPASPSFLKRLSHLWPVRSLNPANSEAWRTLIPERTRSTNRARLEGQDLARLWMFTRVSRKAVVWRFQLPRIRVNNLIGTYT